MAVNAGVCSSVSGGVSHPLCCDGIDVGKEAKF